MKLEIEVPSGVYTVRLTIETPSGETHVETQEIAAADWARMGPTEIMQVLIPLHASVRERWFRSIYAPVAKA